MSIKPNPPITPFPIVNYESYNVVKCIYSVFGDNDILTNISFWTFLSVIVCLVILTFCFICSGLSYADNYIREIISKDSGNKCSDIACPPKATKQINSSVNETNTELEEEDFPDDKIHVKKHKAHLRQNYMKENQLNTVNENKQIDEKLIISKLKEDLEGVNNDINPELHYYYFTKNSENDFNPIYRENNLTIDNNYNSGKSMTYIKMNEKFVQEMLFNDNDEIIEKEKEKEENDIDYNNNQKEKIVIHDSNIIKSQKYLEKNQRQYSKKEVVALNTVDIENMNSIQLHKKKIGDNDILN